MEIRGAITYAVYCRTIANMHMYIPHNPCFMCEHIAHWHPLRRASNFPNTGQAMFVYKPNHRTDHRHQPSHSHHSGWVHAVGLFSVAPRPTPRSDSGHLWLVSAVAAAVAVASAVVSAGMLAASSSSVKKRTVLCKLEMKFNLQIGFTDVPTGAAAMATQSGFTQSR